MTTARRGRAAALGFVGGLALLAAAYGGTAWWLGGQMPRSATVSGVQVGGMTAEAATTALREGLFDQMDSPITLTAGSASTTLAPSDAGLTADIEGTVTRLVGFTLDPRILWDKLTGEVTAPVALTVDQAAYDTALAQAAEKVKIAPKEGSVSFPKGKVTITMPVDGSEVDPQRTLEAIRATWPQKSEVAAVVRPLAPAVGTEEFERFREDFADVAMSGPVTVKAGDKSFPVPATKLAPAIVVTPKDGTLVAKADDKKLVAAVMAEAKKADVGTPAKDAVVTYKGGNNFAVAPSKDGTELDPASITKTVWAALGSNDRTAAVTTRVTKAKFTTEQAKATLPREVISTFTTYFKPGQPRVTNIRLGASRINGTYVPPGGTWSMNKHLGERTAAKGYVQAPGINAGRLENTYGGGISQLSTTVFNASYFAGVRLDDWQAHSLYISRYPEGREATLDFWTIDNVFTNTTKGGILIQASSTPTSVTVTYRGIKTWDITTFKGARYNFTQPRRIEYTDAKCIPQSPSTGFTVNNTRIFNQGGKEVKREVITVKYDASNEIVCKTG